MIEKNKALVCRFCEVGTGDLPAMDEIVTTDSVDHYLLPDMQPGPESAKAWSRPSAPSVLKAACRLKPGSSDSGLLLEQMKA